MTDDTKELDRLDELCAEGIMGCKIVEYVLGGEHWESPNSRLSHVKHWQPTRNISQAFEVLGKLNIHRCRIEFENNNKLWGCNLEFNIQEGWCFSNFFDRADTAPLAIVRACLKAKGLL
jgi:hypothetical protein